MFVINKVSFWYRNKAESKKIMRGGWSGFGMVTVGIHPNDFDLDPNKIPTGGVVQNCLVYKLEGFPTGYPFLFKKRPIQ